MFFFCTDAPLIGLPKKSAGTEKLNKHSRSID